MKYAQVDSEGNVQAVVSVTTYEETEEFILDNHEGLIPFNETLPNDPSILKFDTNTNRLRVLTEEELKIKQEKLSPEPASTLSDTDVSRIAAEVVKQLNASTS